MAFKVFIEQSPMYGGLLLYFVDRNEAMDTSVTMLAKPVQLVFEPVEDGVAFPAPTLRLRQHDATALLRALAEAVDKEGIKTENDHRVAGELKATKLHLEDMRRIVAVKVVGEQP